jgi:outer membrane lipase/esterase
MLKSGFISCFIKGAFIMVGKMLARVLLLLTSFIPAAFAAPVTDLPIRHMYLLGDSLSDQGNLFAATTVIGPPLGQPAIPANDHYFSGRFSNGEVYAGILARKLGFTLTPSLEGGTNFAFGGTRTDYNRVETPRGPYPKGAYPWSLNLQREEFTNRVAAKGADPTGLYVVFSGSNDVADILTLGLNPATTIANSVEGIRNVILAFKAAGARTVLVPNIPNLGLVPGITKFGPRVAALATSLSSQFNTALNTMLDSVTGINVLRFDTFAFLTEVVADPAKYGFSNVTQPCYSGFVDPNPTGTECASPETYLFWDTEHPTHRFHSILAKQLFKSVLQCAVFGRADEFDEDSDATEGPGFMSKCAVNINAYRRLENP